MTDFPEMTIATDRVDPEMVEKPRRWDIRFIRRFMLVFGLLSSVFDFATFAVLLWVLHSNAVHFRTGWFVESVISASMIVLVIRTRRVFFKSRPGKYLLIATLLVAVATVSLPYTPIAKPLGFTPLPAYFFLFLGGIMLMYISSAELAKRFFYRWVKY
jgi:Mg2+-importing ATPase